LIRPKWSMAEHRISVRRLGADPATDCVLDRSVPVEVPVALEYCGLGYAVMMASPRDLEDFITGHAIGEGLATQGHDVTAVDVAQIDGGWVVRASLPENAREKIFARARNRVSDSSCGLCGVDSIAEALRALPTAPPPVPTSRAAIARALADLSQHQPLNVATGAVHAAAFCSPTGDILCVREDVGRHNALDKLIGALSQTETAIAQGFILLSARCSFELVEKSVRAGASMLVTISAPTSLAADRAQAAGLTLVTLARADAVLVVNDPANAIS
jgi:FdhD protein